MTEKSAVRTIGDIRRELRKAHRKLHTWRAVGREWDLNCGMAYRIAMDRYEPKDARIRVKLGLPAMVMAPVCRVCGVVHVSKRCTARPRVKRRDLSDFPVGELRRMLEDTLERLKLNVERGG